jgi:endonuclease YncB( thermonuclease family)
MHLRHWLTPIRHARAIPDGYFGSPGKQEATVLHVLVVRAGDGDGVRVRHLPTLAWLVPSLAGSSRTWDPKHTISVRLAGIDAPEAGHFGKVEQPFAAEARAFLADYVQGRRCTLKLCKRDQYERVVGMLWVHKPVVWWLPFWRRRRNVSLEMVTRGLACVYECKGAEYDGIKEELLAAQAIAK